MPRPSVRIPWRPTPDPEGSEPHPGRKTPRRACYRERRLRAPIALALALCWGCTSSSDRVNPFPVSVDVSMGPISITVSDGNAGEKLPAVVNTSAPVTLIDGFVPGDPVPSPRRRDVELLLYSGTGAGAVPRIALSGVSSFEIHPCTATDAYCVAGVGSQTEPVRAILGADVLSRRAVRFDLPRSALQFFPDIAGSDAARGDACDAVFKSPFAGGGTLILGGSEETFTGNRLALGACLHYDPSTATDQLDRGSDALFIVATGAPISMLSESAYERYRTLVNDTQVAPALADLPTTTVYLPSGPIAAHLGTITRIALVGQGSDKRGPCQELYANHVMSVNGCRVPVQLSKEACICYQATFCSTAAAVEIDRPFAVAVINDLEPLLQALRDELRPTFPEVNGLLAPNAMTPLGFDVNYPNSRALARCEESNGLCRPPGGARPGLSGQDLGLPAVSPGGPSW